VQTIHKQALVAFLSMLAFCAQLASYLCLLIYVTEGEKASTRQPKVR
jgi:hypothetical protein